MVMMWQNSIHSFQNGCIGFYERTHDWVTLRFLEDPNTIILIGGCCLMIKGLDVALMESNS